MDAPEPRGAARARSPPRSSSTARARSASSTRPTAGERGSSSAILGGEIICCGGAFNSPQLLQLSGVGNAAELARARHPGRARPPRCRRAHAGPPRGLHPARVHAAGVDGADAREVAPTVDRHAVARAPRSGRDQPLRGGRLRAQQRHARLPERDVPLPADRDPLRRLDAAGRAGARLPGARRADVLELARLGEDHVDRPDA